MNPSVSSVKILFAYFGLLIIGIVIWVLALLALWKAPASVLLTPESLPQDAVTVYMVGLYLWLMLLIGVVWRKVAARPWTELGLQPSLPRFFRGLLLGTGTLATIMGLEYLLGWVRFAPPPTWPPQTILLSLAAAFAFALSEEALFRGFILRSLAIDRSPRQAILFSAFLFAALHFIRPAFSWSDLVLFLALFGIGIVLAIATLRSGTIWLAVGLHFSWVLFFSLSQQLNLWAWEETGLPIAGGSTIPLLALPLLVPLGFIVLRHDD